MYDSVPVLYQKAPHCQWIKKYIWEFKNRLTSVYYILVLDNAFSLSDLLGKKLVNLHNPVVPAWLKNCYIFKT